MKESKEIFNISKQTLKVLLNIETEDYENLNDENGKIKENFFKNGTKHFMSINTHNAIGTINSILCSIFII